MANSADPDQLASSEANWSGSTLFAKAGYIRAQQGLNGINSLCHIQTPSQNYRNIVDSDINALHAG